MRVAVVIVTYNSAPDLPALLGSIPESDEHHQLEVVVSDSGSSDDSLALASSLRADVTTVDMGANRGYAAGINAAWAAADSPEAMLLLNPDLTLDAGALEPWLRALDADGGVVAPRIRNLDGELEPSLRRRPSAWRALVEAVIGGRLAGRLGLGELVAGATVYDQPSSAPWVSGAAMAVTAACMNDVGPWEERFFLYSEETDFCLRAGERGHSVSYSPDAGVVHRGGEFTASVPLYSLLTWNRVRLIRAHGGAVHAAAMRVAVSVGELVRSFAGSNAGVHRAALGVLWSRDRRQLVLPPETDLTWAGAR